MSEPGRGEEGTHDSGMVQDVSGGYECPSRVNRWCLQMWGGAISQGIGMTHRQQE